MGFFLSFRRVDTPVGLAFGDIVTYVKHIAAML
jgi:hypothetical protein